MAWGDYNNDGFMDLLLTGDPGDYNYISKIYKNNGDGTFTEQTGIQLIGVTRGAVAWGDYNNDGFLDILLTGYAKTGSISIIYKNNGEGNFIEQKGINLIPVEYSSVAWGDYNNDGRLDILLSGNANYSDGGYISKIYKNNGDGTFSDQTNALLSETQYGSVAWGDYNNDGYLDILLTGSSNLVKIYKNNGDGTFSDQTSIFLRKGTISGLGSWVDYNNDGFLDVFLIRESTYPYGGELTLFK
ncbi:MAG TPA: VCBS repeat-containing protein, partial [Bacteroidales bacterium]